MQPRESKWISKTGVPAKGLKSPVFPYVLVCAAPVVWGVSGVLVRWAHLPGKEYVLVFYRSLFALAFYTVIALLRDRRLFRPGRSLPLLAASGVATAAYTLCAFKAYNQINIGAATFIIYLAPVLVALLAPLVLDEKLQGSTLVCIAVALAGTALLSWGQAGGKGGLEWTGVLLALGGAACWAVLMLIWKYLRETCSPVTIGLWTCIVTMLIYAPVAIPDTAAVSGRSWAAIAVFGIVVIGAAGLVWLYGIAHVKAQDAALLSYLEPVAATVLGIVLLSEVVHWQDFAGAALIIVSGAVLLHMRRETEKLVESRAEER